MPKKKKSSSSAPKGVDCVMCEKQFPSQQDCDSHIQDVHGPRFDCQCAHCTGKRRHDSAKLVEELKVKIKGEEVRTFRCIVCKYQVFLMCKCLSHIQTSHNTVSLQKQYECMKCNVGFERCLELHEHILAEHPLGQKIARCGFAHCKKCFSNAQLLQSHLRQNHKVTKPYELLNSIKSGTHVPTPNNNNNRDPPRETQRKKAETDSDQGTSAWLAPDPPSPTPPEKSEKSQPELMCKICKKTHKSQTSYNNHMLVFHKQKYNSGNKKAKKRRLGNDNSDESSDVTSEDSDWEPSNSRPKSTRGTRLSARNMAKKTEDQLSRSNTPLGGNETVTADPNQHNTVTTDPIQHNSHAEEDDCSDCLACQQAKKFASIPAIRIKQEPVDSDEASTLNDNPMPVISNVFSMNGNSDSMLSNDHGNNAYNMGSPQSSHASSSQWQNPSGESTCSNCLTKAKPENKCEHCGIIFLDDPMYMIHKLWHGKNHPFQCHSCGKVCKDKYAFTTHIFKAQHL